VTVGAGFLHFEQSVQSAAGSSCSARQAFRLRASCCLRWEAAILVAKCNDRRRVRRDQKAEFAGHADTEASGAACFPGHAAQVAGKRKLLISQAFW
jgi:hypothetical protein